VFFLSLTIIDVAKLNKLRKNMSGPETAFAEPFSTGLPGRSPETEAEVPRSEGVCAWVASGTLII
jgi:hypothetical protein